MTREVGVDHHPHQLLESDRRSPAQYRARLGWIGYDTADIHRSEKLLVLFDERSIVEPQVRKRGLAKVTYGVATSGSDHKVCRRILLKHAPHGINIVASKPPVATHVQIAQPYLAQQTQLYSRRRIRDFA